MSGHNAVLYIFKMFYSHKRRFQGIKTQRNLGNLQTKKHMLKMESYSIKNVF